MTRTHRIGLQAINVASFVILTRKRTQHVKAEKPASPALTEHFILNTPPLLCGVDEIQINLIDGGETNRAKPSLPFALISPAGLRKQLRALRILLRE